MAGQVPRAPLIAIVDDDGSIRRALGRLVRAHGLSVATYSSGEAFLDGLQDAVPACVLLDLNLPGLAGLEVLRHLAFAGGAIPAIIMTGLDRAGLREQCLAAGAAAFLTKPIDGAQLVAEVEAALRTRTTGAE
jgi:FixJ family two-component response regulator